MSKFSDESLKFPPLTPGDEPAPGDRLAKLEAELAEMKEKLHMAQAETQTARIEAVSKASTAPLNLGVVDAQRERLRASLGLAKWFSLPLNERLKLLGEGPIAAGELEEVKKYFGPNSSHEATILRNSNPRRYQRLRSINREIL